MYVLPRHKHEGVEAARQLPHRRRAVVSLDVDPATSTICERGIINLRPLLRRRMRDDFFVVHRRELDEIQTIARPRVRGTKTKPHVKRRVREVLTRAWDALEM